MATALVSGQMGPPSAGISSREGTPAACGAALRHATTGVLHVTEWPHSLKYPSAGVPDVDVLLTDNLRPPARIHFPIHGREGWPTSIRKL